jgi:hypothetical protein
MLYPALAQRCGKTFVKSTDETGKAGKARKAEFGSNPHISTAISASLRLCARLFFCLESD